MGILDELKKLARPYAEDEDIYNEEQDTQEEQPARAARPARSSKSARRTPPTFDFGTEETEQPAAQETRRSPFFAEQPKVVNLGGNADMQVVLAKPDRFDTVTEITDHLRDGHAVVLNLEGTQKDVSRRLVDFLSGSAYALGGKIRKVAMSTFLVTPRNVNVVNEETIEELENSGMYL